MSTYSNRGRKSAIITCLGSFSRDRHARCIYRQTFIKCVVHDDLGTNNLIYSAASLALRVIFSVS